jgi:cysteine desulfurase
LNKFHKKQKEQKSKKLNDPWILVHKATTFTQERAMKSNIIYFDNNATTQVDPAVLEAMLPYLKEFYGNPSSMHAFGGQVAKAISHAREQLAHLLGCEPSEVLFTRS